MLIVTTNKVANHEIKETKGLVFGSVVKSKNVVKDVGAGFKSLVGGRLGSYEKLLNESREEAIQQMEDKAKELGANAIICTRLNTSTIIEGASEIIAYGTAVVLK